MNDPYETIPRIRVEVEGMKFQMMSMLEAHTAKVNAAVKAAVDAYCTEENIQQVIFGEAMRAIDAAVKEEVKDYFMQRSAGRVAIREAVIAYLDGMDAKDGEADA